MIKTLPAKFNRSFIANSNLLLTINNRKLFSLISKSKTLSQVIKLKSMVTNPISKDRRSQINNCRKKDKNSRLAQNKKIRISKPKTTIELQMNSIKTGIKLLINNNINFRKVSVKTLISVPNFRILQTNIIILITTALLSKISIPSEQCNDTTNR